MITDTYRNYSNKEIKQSIGYYDSNKFISISCRDKLHSETVYAYFSMRYSDNNGALVCQLIDSYIKDPLETSTLLDVLQMIKWSINLAYIQHSPRHKFEYLEIHKNNNSNNLIDYFKREYSNISETDDLLFISLQK